MESELLTIDGLAKRFGVDRSTIQRWRSKGRLPEPATGPKQRNVGWSRACIEGWERAGFMPGGDFRRSIAKVRGAEGELAAIAKDSSLAADVRAMARAGATLLSNPRVPLRMRLDLLEKFLTRLDWSDAQSLSKLTTGFLSIAKDYSR